MNVSYSDYLQWKSLFNHTLRRKYTPTHTHTHTGDQLAAVTPPHRAAVLITHMDLFVTHKHTLTYIHRINYHLILQKRHLGVKQKTLKTARHNYLSKPPTPIYEPVQTHGCWIMADPCWFSATVFADRCLFVWHGLHKETFAQSEQYLRCSQDSSSSFNVGTLPFSIWTRTSF